MKKLPFLSLLAAVVLFGSCALSFSKSSAVPTKLAAERIVSGNALRGVNFAHAWYSGKTAQSMADARAWGVNAARVVLSNGYQWTKTPASEVTAIISSALNLGYSALVLEVHDTTGYGENGAACSLASAVNYWKEIQASLSGYEDFVIVNIGNEPYGNSGYTAWTQDTISAIQSLRAAGFTHTVMVDAPNWGQDWSHTMRDNASAVFAADSLGKIVFSVHMYGVYDTASEVEDYIASFTDAGLPLVIGEFGNYHSDGDPDEESIVSYANEYGVGYFGWSWCGNGGGVEYLDMVNSWNAASPTSWGSWFKENALYTSDDDGSDGASPIMRFEAEAGKLSGTYASASTSGYSGSGYVSGFDSDGDCVTVTVYAAQAGSYPLTIGYASPYGEKIQYLNVNGTWAKNVTFPQASSFGSVDAGTVTLVQGENSITLSKYWGWSDVDYFEVEGTGLTASLANAGDGDEESGNADSDAIDTSAVYQDITAPFDFTGSGEYYWKATSLGDFINSWSLVSLTINDVDVTNRWVSASALPAKMNGYYYVRYLSENDWGHVGFGR